MKTRGRSSTSTREPGRVVRALAENVSRVIEGKDEPILLSLICLVSGGHLLIEDVPGVGKTLLAKALAKSTSCIWRRIQFTPDLLASDVTGVSVFDRPSGRFKFQHGAIFANLVLGDEINRASPKTQSALLEAMEERQVTADGVTYTLPEPFMVMATQNPYEHEGIYPLPQSQVDRFTMRIRIGYPERDAELEILDAHGADSPLDDLSPVATPARIISLINAARAVHATEGVKRYIVDLCDATRKHSAIQLGGSPRAALFLLRTARSRALALERDFVVPDDVKALVSPVLAHRLVLSADAEMRNVRGEDVLEEILASVPVPPSR